jgi:phosphatidylserine/phosphatidylglycerophosphate/cardiolipin synthase-like enzyme
MKYKLKISKRRLLIVLGVWLLLVGWYQVTKPVPVGISYAGPIREVAGDQVEFLADRTYQQDGERVMEHEIFDEVFSMIDEAEEYILVDMFLFNDFLGTETEAERYLSAELTDRLLAKQSSNSDVTIQVITDPINTLYGGYPSPHLRDLEAVGIPVIITRLEELRDSNPLYSVWWRTFLQWFGNSDRPGWLPNPLTTEGQKLSARTYLTLLNYKANHRKVIVADTKQGEERVLSALVSSANPHDGSSAHSNSAVRVDGPLALDVIRSEAAVAAFSGHDFAWPREDLQTSSSSTNATLTIAVQVITEEAIEHSIVSAINQAGPGDQIDVAVFYLSDREVVDAFKQADERGARLRLLLDANKDAFGREKNGVPNRQVAHELMKHTSGNTTVRWCNTNGEQCHSKMLLVTRGDTTELILGSANFTRRNLDDYNLETNVAIVGSSTTPALAEAQQFFDEQWSNADGVEYSLPYEVFADDSIWRTMTYRFKEFSGLSRW